MKDGDREYYKTCSHDGIRILIGANFPDYTEYINLECIDVIEKLHLDFCLGNCFKYIWRLGNKGAFLFFGKPAKMKDDLDKAIWYCDRYIKYCGQYSIDRYPWSDRLLNALLEYYREI